MTVNSATVKTHDLGLAAALVSCGFTMVDTERNKSGRICFVFIETPDIEHAISAYWDDSLNIQARKFFDNTKMLKGRIYAE